MKTKFLLFAGLFFLMSCSGESQPQTTEEDLDQSFQELQEEINGPVWSVRGDAKFFEMEIPTQMEAMDELNPDASLEYGYMGKFDGEVKENYVIVMVEPFPEEEVDAEEVDLDAFSEAYVDSLMVDKKSFEIINKPVIEAVNEMSAINYEMTASLQISEDKTVDIYYCLGVFLGKKGLYQVLSWTLLNQKDDFRSDMRHMIYSFKEI